MNTWETMGYIGRDINASGNEPLHVFTGEIVGASFYDDEKGGIRPTPRLYIDMDEDIPVGHYRVYVIAVDHKEGKQE